jgi:hypothetical protein
MHWDVALQVLAAYCAVAILLVLLAKFLLP